MSNQRVCAECSSRPRGIAGHAQLRHEDNAATRSLYRCADCSALWARTYIGGGAFVWELMAVLQGEAAD